MEHGQTDSIDIAHFRDTAHRIEAEVARVMVAQDDIVRHVLICILAGGHALIEGVPGLGKTRLVKTLASVLDLKFNRIQFTPDLMPADITGTNILVEDERGRRTFEFQEDRSSPISSSPTRSTAPRRRPRPPSSKRCRTEL